MQEKQAMRNEMDPGMRQDLQKELAKTTEGQNPGAAILEYRSGIQFATYKIDEELLARQELNDNCQERQSVYLGAER
jgi:hypothetical protein